MSYSKLFYEIGDIEIARKLVFNFDKICIDYDENDKYKNKKSQKSILCSVLYSLENKKPVTYAHVNGKKSGRVYSKGGMQFLKRELRNAICHKYYYDIDIKNAQPTCLLWWCNEIGMNVPVLTEYCTNRNNYYHLKQSIIEILYGGGLPDTISADDLNFLGSFKAETKKIHEMILNRKEYSKQISQIKKKQTTQIEQKKRTHFNIGGSLCSEILQGFENTCLQTALQFFETKNVNISNFILMFDGFQMPIELWYPELLDELNAYILEQTKINAVFVKKEMDDIFAVPNDWIYDPKELKNREIREYYDREKIEFEKTICRIEQPLQYLEQNTDNSIYLCNKNELAEKFAYLNCHGTYFIKMWSEDKYQKKYKKIDFLPPPKVASPDIFNLWSGFEIEKTSNPDNSLGIDTFKKIISIMSNNNSEMETYIANCIAHIIQRPAEQLPISLVLVGLEGTGKNIFGDILKSLIGTKYCFETADLENEVFCRFKYNVMNKLLLIINEADPSETFKYEQKLKHWIGNGKTQSFESKGTKPIEMEIFFFILLITNNMISPVNITATDRRYVITETSTEYRCNETFWGNVVDTFKDPENLKGVFNYFNTFQITIKNWGTERPITKIYQRVKSICFDKIIKGLRTLVLDEWEYSETETFSNERLYKLFNISKQDELSFSTRLAQKHISGLESTRNHQGRGWVINRVQTYNWLKENKYIFDDETMQKVCRIKDIDQEIETDF